MRNSEIVNGRGRIGGALYIEATGFVNLYDAQIINCQSNNDEGIYVETGGVLTSAGLRITPPCTTSNPMIALQTPTTLNGLRNVTAVAPECSRLRKLSGVLESTPLLSLGSNLSTCASSPHACAKGAECTDEPVAAGAATSSPLCTCVAPKVPVPGLVPHVAPYVDGCRSVCPGGQVLLAMNGSQPVCGCREGLAFDADAGQCLPCELGSWSLAGSQSCDVCVPGQYKRDAQANVRLCTGCPDGASCPTNTLMSSLLLEPAHWRLSPNTTTIRKCAIGTNGTSPCLGGVEAADFGVGYCREGYVGALCQTCSQAGFVFIADRGVCELCPEVGDVAAQVFAMVVGFIAILVSLAFLYRLTDSKERPRVKRWSRWFFGMAVALNPTAKLKILYAFLQASASRPLLPLDLPSPPVSFTPVSYTPLSAALAPRRLSS